MQCILCTFNNTCNYTVVVRQIYTYYIVVLNNLDTRE